jgi:hypothetical protein
MIEDFLTKILMNLTTDEIWYLYDMQLVDDELNIRYQILQPDLQMSYI